MSPRWAAWLAGAVACGTGRPSAPEGERWVSLAPQITETVAALGAADLLVGRSDWDTLPPEVTALPPVGSALTPNLEGIVALRPTLVLVEAAPSARTDELSAVARTEALAWLTLDDLVASTERLGALAGRRRAAAELVGRFRATLAVEPPAQGPSVLLALAGEGLDRGEIWFLKRNSLHGAALHAAGARNAVDRDVAGLPVLSVEAVLALDPEAIVVLSPTALDAPGRERVMAEWRRLAPLRAVRQGKVAVLAGPELLSTGPSITALADRLRGALAELAAADTRPPSGPP